MRNAPLVRAIIKHPKAKAISGRDERGHAYRALSHIKIIKRPAALVCTSGTAVANFLPAVIEAEKTHIPLMILSADRPGELNATDANQTINQVEVLRNYTKVFWQASEPQSTFPPNALAGKISFLVAEATKGPRGPMHLNIPLREPLDETPQEVSPLWRQEVEDIIQSKSPSLSYAPTNTLIAKENILELSKKIKNASRPLVVFGPLNGLESYCPKKVTEFIEKYKGSFFCDIGSGLKYQFGSSEGLIPTLDHPEVLSVLESKEPDLVIHFGHRLTSKHYYPFLRRLREKSIALVQICDGHLHEDPGFAFTERWPLPPQKALEQIIEELQEQDGKAFIGPLVDWSELIQKKRAIIEGEPLSYPFISKRAVETLHNVHAFIGNSTFIRSFDSYASEGPLKNDWSIQTNRGASGIEGHLAMTYSLAVNNHRTISFMGDVSFGHDLSSLIYFKEALEPISALIVIANNHGGGIFKLLPIGKQGTDYLNLLTTPHQYDFKPLLEGWGLPCKKVSSKEDYVQALKDWNESPELLFLEVVFNDEDNVSVYNQLKTVKL